MGDNQWSYGVVIARFCSFEALDHQRQVLHQSSLSYLSEDRDSTSYQEIWFFDESRMILGYTSLTHDGKGLSLCTRLQALNLIVYSTLMATRFLILGISSIYAVFILDQLGHLLLVPGD
jgi:hypothetical protein